MTLQLVQYSDTSLALRKVCRSDFSLGLRDINEMFFLLREQDGLGLAAPQVGIDARLFVTHWDEVFINPRIVELRGPFRAVREGCLSLPNVSTIVNRWSWIRLASGQVFRGSHAAIIQHEIDHLNGILIIDPIHQGVH